MHKNLPTLDPTGKGLFFLSLGGIGEIGANCYLYSCDNKWIMIDLGLTFADDNDSKDIEAAPFIDLLISIRKELREAKQFSVADSIRDNLTALGVTLEDSPKGTTWKKH